MRHHLCLLGQQWLIVTLLGLVLHACYSELCCPILLSLLALPPSTVLSFSPSAHLDEGSLWPSAHAAVHSAHIVSLCSGFSTPAPAAAAGSVLAVPLCSPSAGLDSAPCAHSFRASCPTKPCKACCSLVMSDFSSARIKAAEQLLSPVLALLTSLGGPQSLCTSPVLRVGTAGRCLQLLLLCVCCPKRTSRSLPLSTLHLLPFSTFSCLLHSSSLLSVSTGAAMYSSALQGL